MTLRMAQIGTKHGHAAGKALSMRTNPAVDFAGLYEADPAARTAAQGRGDYGDSRWFDSVDELLGDASITAVAIEGSNAESLDQARAAVAAGKHLWYDKPAGDDWPGFQALMDEARARGLLVQMGYMFRYQPGFQQVADWAKSGLLGEITSIRAHMSTNIPVGDGASWRPTGRAGIGRHQGGIFYDLGGHMLDQIVWLLGRPARVTAFLRNDATLEVPDFADNTLGVFEFERALAFVDISAMEPRPMARRFEVYGTLGSAILEPFDPCRLIRLCLERPGAGYGTGEHLIEPPLVQRQEMYDRELAAFVATLRGERPPDRPAEHELLVQETLLRATRRLG
jgi:predicted dehydrogenase